MILGNYLNIPRGGESQSSFARARGRPNFVISFRASIPRSMVPLHLPTFQIKISRFLVVILAASFRYLLISPGFPHLHSIRASFPHQLPVVLREFLRGDRWFLRNSLVSTSEALGDLWVPGADRHSPRVIEWKKSITGICILRMRVCASVIDDLVRWRRDANGDAPRRW